MAYSPVTVSPTQGGDLITNYSHENVGANNYVTKRDWRRDFDTEVRREGSAEFQPNTDVSLGEQGNPGGENQPITLLHMARSANGQTCVIAGNQENLYRYLSLDEGPVYQATGTNAPTYETTGTDAPAFFLGSGSVVDSGSWILIGTGFSLDGHRWEACNVAGKVVFNNGVDLPVIYDPAQVESVTHPLYELREQGIASVGAITEFDGLLVLGNVLEIDSATLPDLLLGTDSGVITASQSGYLVTASADIFTEAHVGMDIIFDDNSRAQITVYNSPVDVAVDRSQTVTAQIFSLAVGYGPYSDPDVTSRIRYRVLWSGLGDAEEYGAAVPADSVAGDATLTLAYPRGSLNVGDTIVVVGAGTDSGNLETSVVSISDGGLTIEMQDVAVVTNADAFLWKTAGVSTISGYNDLQDDSSGILRLTQLQGRLIVCKETSFFVGRLTGVSPGVFAFDKLYAGPKALVWPWMLSRVGGQYLLYAGQTRFYALDLSGTGPQEHPKLSMCDRLFFGANPDHARLDDYFSGVNELTSEVWFKLPSGTDNLLCYDYFSNTCSTSAKDITSVQSVLRPAPRVDDSTLETWCLMGTSDGFVLRYGLTDRTAPFWTRESNNYTSTLKSGLVSFGDDFDQKDWRTHILYAGTDADTLASVTVRGYAALTPGDTPVLKFTRILDVPQTKNLTPVWFRANLFQDEITVSGSALPFRITRRLFEVAGTASRGFSNVDAI